jgi:membrane associated rhomboid family serine protease
MRASTAGHASPPTSELGARPRGWLVALGRRVPVSLALSGVFLVGAVSTLLVMRLADRLMLTPVQLTAPWNWYRLLTYTLAYGSLRHWLVVAGLVLVSGWLAERWLDRRRMWTVAAVAAVVGGLVYALLAASYQPLAGGGSVAAGFAGAAVAACALRRRLVSRGAQVVALALLLMYGLAPLRPDAASLSMLGAFLAAGGYAARRLWTSGRAAHVEA